MLPAVSAAATMEPDPIFDAIEMHRRIWADDFAVACQLDQAEDNLEDCRAHSLVGWRKYSHIGGSEIDHAREEFLRDAVADSETIEREYRTKKAEHRAGERAGRDWDRKHGLEAVACGGEGIASFDRIRYRRNDADVFMWVIWSTRR